MIFGNDIQALFAGTAEFNFQPEAVRGPGWLDFGNVKDFQFDPGFSSVERKQSLRGLIGPVRKVRTTVAPTYTFTCDELSRQQMIFLYGMRNFEPTGQVSAPYPAAATEAPALAEYFADPLDFSLANPSVPRLWYDLTRDGNRIRPVVSVVLTDALSGGNLRPETDYFVDQDSGRITFAEMFFQPVSVQVVAAARESAPVRQVWRELFTEREVRGKGRLILWNQEGAFLEHNDFPCTLEFAGLGNQADDWSSFRVTATLHPPYGEMERALDRVARHEVRP